MTRVYEWKSEVKKGRRITIAACPTIACDEVIDLAEHAIDEDGIVQGSIECKQCGVSGRIRLVGWPGFVISRGKIKLEIIVWTFILACTLLFVWAFLAGCVAPRQGITQTGEAGDLIQKNQLLESVNAQLEAKLQVAEQLNSELILAVGSVHKTEVTADSIEELVTGAKREIAENRDYYETNYDRLGLLIIIVGFILMGLSYPIGKFIWIGVHKGKTACIHHIKGDNVDQ